MILRKDYFYTRLTQVIELKKNLSKGVERVGLFTKNHCIVKYTKENVKGQFLSDYKFHFFKECGPKRNSHVKFCFIKFNFTKYLLFAHPRAMFSLWIICFPIINPFSTLFDHSSEIQYIK